MKEENREEFDSVKKSENNFTHTEITCDIIRDLLPSYVDGICSDDSRKIVEQHLSACADCAALTAALRESETTTRQKEAKQIAYLKKVKKHTGAKELIGLGILLVTIGFTLRILIEYYKAVSWIYFLALPLILADTHFLLADHTAKNQRTEPKTALTLVSGLLICAGLLIAWISILGCQKEQYPFGLTPATLGHFLEIVYNTLALCEFIIFVAAIVLNLKTANSHGTLISISTIGFFLMLYTLSAFASMSTTQGTMKALGQSAYLLLEGGIIAAIIAFLEKRKLREG
ncbi:MAG: zf-HC2 domain-containing protein [Lachnospiraceae bacterium]|nr:zf-HC2 domain-containing protein [Lachnospiraceae bacterium]